MKDVKTLNNISIMMAIASLFVCFLTPTLCFAKEEPTATIIDNETGKPIEGAVAIAIWRKTSTKDRAWFEGGTEIPSRIEEAVSDKNGNIFIKKFWNWHLLETHYPRLTVYKFGYVCWDQKLIMREGSSEKRNDFNKYSRIIKMMKWPKWFSFHDHYSFIQACTRREYDLAPTMLFQNAIMQEEELEYKEYLQKKKQ
jgi:hypothetical protein